MLQWETATDPARPMEPTTCGYHNRFHFSPEKARAILVHIPWCVHILWIQYPVRNSSLQPRCPVSHACWWSWAGKRWTSSSSPPKPRQWQRCIRNDQREHEWCFSYPTASLSLARIPSGWRGKILEQHQLDTTSSTFDVGWHAGGWTSVVGRSNRSWLSSYVKGCPILQKFDGPSQT